MALGTTNIDTRVVGNAIGSGSNDVGTLCTSPLINKNSLYRPIIAPNKIDLPLDEFTNYDYGWSKPPTINLSAWAGTVLDGWIPHLPTGGMLSPFRIGDFRGYEHLATECLLQPNDIHISLANIVSWKYTLILETDTYDNNSFRYRHLTNLKDMYYGVMIRNAHNGTVVLVKTARDQIKYNNEFSNNIVLNMDSSIPTDDYLFFFFITYYWLPNQVTSLTGLNIDAYPMHYSVSHPNPVMGSIAVSLYPIDAFDFFDSWLIIDNYWRSPYYTITSRDYYYQEQMMSNSARNSFMKLVVTDSPDNPLYTDFCYFEIDFNFTFSNVSSNGDRYNIIRVNDIDGDGISFGLSYNGGQYSPYIYMDVDQSFVAFDKQGLVILDGDAVNCKLRYSTTGVTWFLKDKSYAIPKADLDNLQLSLVVFGYDNSLIEYPYGFNGNIQIMHVKAISKLE